MTDIPSKTGNKKYGDFVVIDGKMLFNRVGPVNAQYQKKNKAVPEKRGVWAFPYPIFDYFFVSAPCSTPYQASPNDDKIITIDNKIKISILKRLKGLKRKYDKDCAKHKNESFYSEAQFEIKELEEALQKGEIKGNTYASVFRKTKLKHGFKIHRFFWDGPVYARFAPKGLQTSELGWYLYPNIYAYIEQLRKQLIHMCKANYIEKGWQKFAVNIVAQRDWSLGTDHLEVFIPMKAI